MILPGAFNSAPSAQCKQESCINRSAYDEVLSMWSHRKKISFTRYFVEAKQIHFADSSKLRAHPEVVGITTSNCVIAEKNT